LANIDCTITYNPNPGVGQTTWSASENPIQVVPPGNTPIRWSIEVANGQSGTIDFSITTAAPGIVFIPPPVWPGEPPSGNANNWHSSLDDNLGQGASAIIYNYVVNAVYTPSGNSSGVNVQWDPEVEENPPANVVFKAR
jgi:hypothetical protein